MMFFKVVCFLAVVNIACAKITSRVLEGYPAGYLSDCKYNCEILAPPRGFTCYPARAVNFSGTTINIEAPNVETAESILIKRV